MALQEEDIKQIRNIIQEELANFIRIDRYVFDKNIQILNARNVQLGRENGTKFGTATDQLLAFYGITPVDQPATVADPTGGATQDAEARTAVIEIIDRLQELGLIST